MSERESVSERVSAYVPSSFNCVCVCVCVCVRVCEREREREREREDWTAYKDLHSTHLCFDQILLITIRVDHVPQRRLVPLTGEATDNGA